MNCLELSHHIISEVLINSKTFAFITKKLKNRKDVDSVLRADANSISGSALRHYLVFKPIIEKAYPLLPEEQFISALIHLTNMIFTHTVSKTETIDFCIESFNKVNLDFDYKLFDELNASNLIDPSLEKDSAEYLSYRFNIPLWLSKMWLKHYKAKLTYLIMRGISNKMSIYVQNIEDSEPNYDEFIAKYGDFEKTEFGNLLKYVGKIPLVKTQAFQDRTVFSTRPGIAEAFNKIDIDPARGIAVYQGSNYQYYLDFVSKFSSRISFDLLCADGATYYDAKRTLYNYKLRQVRLYESNSSIMNLCISEKVHTFFLFPKCSEFTLLRTTPDYGIHFSREQLDQLLVEQKTELEEASKIVEDNGYLFYGVPTISKKESEIMIRNFLKEHHNFNLVEEKQYFPFDKYDSTFYYAILQKVGNDD